jgi:hypothetical protein
MLEAAPDEAIYGAAARFSASNSIAIVQTGRSFVRQSAQG